MGKDIPLKRDLRPRRTRATARAASSARCTRPTPTSSKVVDTAMGLEGLKRQWGVHAAGVIMSSEPLIDVIPIMKRRAGRRDHHAVRLPDLRDARPDQDGLPGAAQPHHPRRRAEQHRRPTAARRSCSRTSPLDDPTTYELLARGDTLGVFQLDGGPMRALLRSMRPDNFEDISAVGALYRPGPMGANSHNNYAHRKNGREPIDADPPRARRAARGRSSATTYGLIVYQEQVMAIAQKLAGYSLGQADLLRRAMGKKKKAELDKQFAGFSGGHAASAATRTAAIKTLWDILLPFSDYAFNKAHSAAYGLVVLLDRLPQGQLPGRVHGRAAHLASGTTRTRWRSTSTSAAGWASRCCRPTSTSPTPTSPRSAPTSGSGSPRSATSATTSSTRSSPAREEKGRFTDFNDFLDKVAGAGLQQAGHRVADQGRRVRLAGAPAPGAGRDPRDRRRPVRRHQAQRGDRPGLAVRRPRRRRRRRLRASRSRCPTSTSGTRDAARPRARDARPLRLRPPAARPRARPVQRHRLHHRPAAARRGPARRLARSPSPG